MEVKATDSFFKSLKKITDSTKWWTFWYWVDVYYNVKRAISALWKYFPIVIKMVPWDYSSVLEMMQFQIKVLADYIEKNGIEVRENSLPKVQKMRRFVELAQNHSDDNYAERCGYIYTGFDFEETDDHPGCYKMVEKGSKEEQETNIRAIKAAHKLEEKEWNEMIDLLKDMRSWWD